MRLDFNDIPSVPEIELAIASSIEWLRWVEGYLMSESLDEPGSYKDVFAKNISQLITALNELNGAPSLPDQKVTRLRRLPRYAP